MKINDLFASQQEKVANARICEMLCDGTDAERSEIAKCASSIISDGITNGFSFDKKAQTSASVEGLDKVTRTQIREGSFMQKILPPEDIGDDRLVPGPTEDLFVIDHLEPNTAGAKWIPLDTVPDQQIIYGSRYATPMARIVTRKFEKDIAYLRTYPYDIRQLVTDNSIKDGQAVFDTKGVMAVNSIVFNASGAGKANYDTDKVQWADLGNLDRASWAEATKLLNRSNRKGDYGCNNYIALMNNLTAKDFLKFGRDAIGGDLAQELFKDGMTLNTIEGIRIVTTVKQWLIPDGYVYFFAEPRFLGHCYRQHDWEMFLKKEAWNVTWFSYWLGGMSFGNVAGMALARFGSACDDKNPLESNKFLPECSVESSDGSASASASGSGSGGSGGAGSPGSPADSPADSPAESPTDP